ncbi:FRIGIDA-like protein 3 [Arachis ipaensis]|uniref:FRIGIDA-like protein 3 n=1 Tax=Arachis ipaensis TaxID=130454 RepID=UPI0007AEF375|nr:FRIGIDA-like protein 3 [Arachis ipaensis]
MNMPDMEQAGEDVQSLMGQLAQAFIELEARKEASETKIQWDEIKQHFQELEVTMNRKLEEIEAKEKEYEQKELEMNALLAEREAEVASREQDLLDRVQDLKDAAVSAIVEARANHQTATLESVENGESKENKVSSSIGDANSPEEDFPHKSGENTDGVATEIRPRPELTQFCEHMDAKGLLNYVLENEHNLSVIREDICIALEHATEPARLVLDSLEGFYPTNETTEPKDKMDDALQGMRKSCIIIMEAMANLLAKADPGADHLLNPETKQQAKAIADEWRSKLASADVDAANGNSLEAEAFLQLLSTFRIASEFAEEQLCKLLQAAAQCRQAPELCRSIGLTHKVPAIVDLLINEGTQIAAVHFIHSFQLEEAFPTVPLLKVYLKNLRRNSQVRAGNVGDIAIAKNDANARELAGLKTVINCIKEYNLEADYPLDSLLKRVGQLEKSKNPDRKRSGDFNKRPPSKKPRMNSGYHRSSGGSAAPAGVMVRQHPPVRAAAYAGIPDRYPHAGTAMYNYQVPGQAMYAQPSNAAPNRGRYMSSGLQSSHKLYM